MLEKLLLPEVRELLSDGDHETLRELLNGWPAVDVSDLLADLSTSEAVAAFRLLDPSLAATTFVYLPRSLQDLLLQALEEVTIAAILNELAPDDRTAILEEQSSDETERLLTLLTPENQRIARGLLSYSAGTVGRLMTPDYIEVQETWTIDQVLQHIRRVGKDSESLNAVYVVDAQKHLIDDIRIRDILLSQPESIVAELMDRKYAALQVTDAETDAVETFRKYDRTVLPVVDRRGLLLGVVTVDDVLDVAEESATREIQKFGGLEALDEPYATTPMLQMVKKRATWLVVLFLGEMLTASAMGAFEDEMKAAVVLTFFIPLIISSGGNSGSQAATLMVRALAVGEVKLHDWGKVMRREIASGLLLGLILAVIGFCRIALWSAFSDIYGPHWALVGLTVAVSLVGIVLWGALSGSMLPFVIKRCGLDPATSSAPFVATLVDVTGLIIYFTAAAIILRGTLL